MNRPVPPGGHPIAGHSAVTALLRRFATLTLVLAVAGCATGPDYFAARPYHESAAPAGDELPPLDGKRFTYVEGQAVVGEIQRVRARYEDTFVDFARAYGLGYDDLVAANPGIDPWLPGEGTEIILPTRHVLPLAPHEGIVLNIAARRLFYFPPVAAEPRVVYTFPIGIGRAGWSTPTGATEIVARIPDPVWFPPDSVLAEYAAAGNPLPRRVPPGPDNPLGKYAIMLDIPGYFIHGTNKPAGVGMRVSHGCVRLYPEDIEYLFGEVSIGVRVRIVNQPYLFGWDQDRLYFEAHAPLAEDGRDWSGLLTPMARSSRLEAGGALEIAGEQTLQKIAADHHGMPVMVGRRSGAARAQPPVRQVMNILPAASLTEADTATP